MDSLVFPVEQSKYNTAVESGVEPRTQYEVHAFSRLSTFHMPRAVDISFSDADVMEFRLEYPNQEPPERTPRSADSDGSIEVLLGKHSRKILSLRFGQAIGRLSAGPLRFNPAISEGWIADLPRDAVFACRRNAEVVAAILAAMPDETRQQLLDAARRAKLK